MPPPIAIIGGGPSGLALARIFEVHGFDYIVYEQSGQDVPPGVHGTLDMHPDSGQAALKEARLFEEFQKVAGFDLQINCAFDHHGQSILRTHEDLPQIDWHDLRALFVNSIPAEKIRWESKISAVDRSDDGSLTITFEDGSVEKGFKLVVGADGVWSKVRHLVTAAKPKYFGVTFLRTSISHDSAFWSTVQARMALTNYYAVGLRRQVVAQKNVAGTYTVYVGLLLPEDWGDGTLSNPDAFRTKLLQTELANYKASVLNFVRHSDGEFYVWRHYTMPTESLSWDAVPGVALIGDAAHPTLPWPGEAMGCVLHDSLELGQQIAKYGVDGMDQAVAEYEKLMFPRRKEYIEKCAELGDLFYRKDAVELIEALLTGAPQG